MTPEERELLTLKMKVKSFENKQGWQSSIHRKVLRLLSVYLIVLAFAWNYDLKNPALIAIAPTLIFGFVELLHPLFGRLIGKFVKFDE
jgi:hypothetical protein